MKNPPILGLLITATGIVLIMSAVYDLNPVSAFKAVATGQNPKSAKATPAGDGGGGGGSFPNAPAAASTRPVAGSDPGVV